MGKHQHVICFQKEQVFIMKVFEITKIMPISGFHFLENIVSVVIQCLWHFKWNKLGQSLISGMFPCCHHQQKWYLLPAGPIFFFFSNSPMFCVCRKESKEKKSQPLIFKFYFSNLLQILFKCHINKSYEGKERRRRKKRRWKEEEEESTNGLIWGYQTIIRTITNICFEFSILQSALPYYLN